MSLKAKIEAILFLTDKPVRAQTIARIINADVQAIRQSLLELIHDYEERDGGLEIADEDGYSFQVKDKYASLMDEFLPVEMSAALLRTLSSIAIKQPISQSEIIRIRGAGAYEHVRELVNKDLVAKKDDGRSPLLSTTKKFQEYFRLTRDGKSLRSYLKKQVRAAEARVEAEQQESGRQLVIASVVAGDSLSEADLQLNQSIYLETAADEVSQMEDEADVFGMEEGDLQGLPVEALSGLDEGWQQSPRGQAAAPKALFSKDGDAQGAPASETINSSGSANFSAASGGCDTDGKIV